MSLLKKYYFKNKIIILFASSGCSLFGKTINVLEKFVDSSNIIIEGKVFHNLNKKDIDKMIKIIMKMIINTLNSCFYEQIQYYLNIFSLLGHKYVPFFFPL